MFAQAQAASPRPGRKRLAREEGKAEGSSGEREGGTALGPWATGVGCGGAQREPVKVSGVLNLGDWQAGTGLGALSRGTWPPGSHLEIQYGSPPHHPSPIQLCDERASSGAWADVGWSRSPGKGPVCYSTEGDLCEGGGERGQVLGRGLEEPETT